MHFEHLWTESRNGQNLKKIDFFLFPANFDDIRVLASGCFHCALLSVLRRWLCSCWFIVIFALDVCLGFVFGPYFVVEYFVSFLVLQSPRRGRESRLLYFKCVLAVVRQLVPCVSSSRCHGLVCNCYIFWSCLFIL